MGDASADAPNVFMDAADAIARPDGGTGQDAAMLDAATLDAALPVDADAGTSPLRDPGRDAWEPVPREDVADLCRLDPELLDAADARLQLPWGIVRYGRLCHEYYPRGDAQITQLQENWSATKTLGATVVGIAAHQTRDLPRTGRKTGPLSDLDRVEHWLDDFSFNPDAHVSHVLGMVAYNDSLAWGDKAFAYDAFGDREINRLSDIVRTAIAQDPARFGEDLEAFTQRFLFEPVGMRHSRWSSGAADKVFGYSWESSLRDMMRLGLLLLHGGVWSDERVLGSEWVYAMTHPSFEDSAQDYGYLTWLEAAPVMDECLSTAIHARFPHGSSQATDCNGPATDFDCSQRFDVGVWHANGLLGQLIVGMPGLDMVIVIKDFGTHPEVQELAALPAWLWPVVRPAVVALDPVYAGDDDAFCEAYGQGRHAPDLH